MEDRSSSSLLMVNSPTHTLSAHISLRTMLPSSLFSASYCELMTASLRSLCDLLHSKLLWHYSRLVDPLQSLPFLHLSLNLWNIPGLFLVSSCSHFIVRRCTVMSILCMVLMFFISQDSELLGSLPWSLILVFPLIFQSTQEHLYLRIYIIIYSNDSWSIFPVILYVTCR